MTVAALALLLNAVANSSVSAQPIAELPAIEAGAQTRGGVADNANILIVSNLSDKGPGSLRTAIETEGSRIIVFETAGMIWLQSDLTIREPFITIAGQTAPSPGITVRGAKVSVQTHNVVIQHLSIRPGASHDPETNRNRDALSINSCEGCLQPTQDVRVENVSASWAVDEVIGIWGTTLSRVTVRNSIIAEALVDAGHPKGKHSMGMLVGKQVQGLTVAGNLFANNVRRNPVISSGVSALVANNFIYNPGMAGIHFYPGPQVRASVIGNVMRHGPSSKAKLKMFQAPKSFSRKAADALIYGDDNHCCTGLAANPAANIKTLKLTKYAPVKSNAWQLIPSIAVWPWIQRYSGSRPKDRNLVDRRIFKDIEANGGRMINQAVVSGSPFAVTRYFHKLDIPAAPFETLSRSHDFRRIEAWLCEKHLEVGGPPTPECPRKIEFYQEQLTQ